MRLAVEETALTQLPSLGSTNCDSNRRGSGMPAETGSLLSESGDIGQTTLGMVRSASAYPSTSTLTSQSEMPCTNVNHTPKVASQLTLLDGVMQTPDTIDGAGTIAVVL